MFDLSISDQGALRSAFGRFPSGVAALCAELDGEPIGLVASSFTVGVSMDPPLVLFAVQNSSTTWPELRTAERIGVSVLGREHDLACRQLASTVKESRFRGVATHVTDSGALFIDASPLWLECEISSESPAGDHQVVVLEVKALQMDAEVEPLVFHGSAFRRLAIA